MREPTSVHDDRPPGQGRTVLVVSPHADDATLFCGGTIRLMANRGARIVLLRVTDDRFDSVGLSVEQTIAANTRELQRAAGLLGVDEIVELGWQTDQLGDGSEVALRERFIFHVRRVRPYAVLSFDPYDLRHEDNQDHVRVAQALDESYWTAQFDKHHPEHFAAGLAPHGVYERWYFARRLTEVTTAIDISTTLPAKIEAALAHATMLRHYAHQLVLQAQTGGHTLPLAEAAVRGELRPLLEPLLTAGASAAGARHGLAAAEEFRVVRFGGLERWFGIGESA